MSVIPVSVQLYSVRDVASADLLGTISKVAEIGYTGVEFAGLHGNDPKAVRKALDDAGLECSGTHTSIDAFSDDKLLETVEIHKILGTEYAIVPWIPESMRNSVEATLETAKRLTELTHKLAEHGLKTGFHAHAGDMIALPSGETPWNLLASNTPDSFVMQYDTANGLGGGADPVQPILDFPGRSVLVHLKEWKKDGHALISEGEVPWLRVFEACESVGGTKWYVVEHEDDPRMTSMEAIEGDFKALVKLGKA
jgi:sugar phosphate isomerase/epimerase